MWVTRPLREPSEFRRTSAVPNGLLEPSAISRNVSGCRPRTVAMPVGRLAGATLRAGAVFLAGAAFLTGAVALVTAFLAGAVAFLAGALAATFFAGAAAFLTAAGARPTRGFAAGASATSGVPSPDCHLR